MRSIILFLTLIIVFSFSAFADAQDVKYAIIQIPTDGEGGVQIYFIDERGESIITKEKLRIAGIEEKDLDKWPLPVNKNVKYLDHAIWYIGSPICIWYDRRRV